MQRVRGKLLGWGLCLSLGLGALALPTPARADIEDWARKDVQDVDAQALGAALQGADPAARKTALETLRNELDGYRVSVDSMKILAPVLLGMLRDADEDLRLQSLDALTKFSSDAWPPGLQAKLREGLTDPAPSVRARTLELASGWSLEPADALQIALNGVADAEASVRVAALQLLSSALSGSFAASASEPSAAATPTVLPGLESLVQQARQAILDRSADPEPLVRVRALGLFSYLPRSASTAKLLTDAAKEASAEVRVAVLSMLPGLLEDQKAAQDLLIQALSDPEPRVVQSAANTLSSFVGPAQRDLLAALQEAQGKLASDRGSEAMYAAYELERAIDRIRLRPGTVGYVWASLLPFLLASFVLRRGKRPEPRRRVWLGVLILLFSLPLSFSSTQLVEEAAEFYRKSAGTYTLNDALIAGKILWIHLGAMLVLDLWIAWSLTGLCFLPQVPVVLYAGIAFTSMVSARWLEGTQLVLVLILAGLGFALPAWTARILWGQASRGFGKEGNETARKRARIASIVATVLSVIGLIGGAFLTLMAMALATGLHGRPFRVRGRARVAPETTGADWMGSPQPRTDGLPAADREALARAWLEDAQAEHASVAAFSRLGLELMAAGAPPALLERTHRAALDEVQHARLCFGLAAAYAGREVGPGPFPEAVEASRNSLPADRRGWLVLLATDSMRDGCLGEGLAAAIAAEARDRAGDAAVRDVLEVVARDEARHAELGWSVLEWCLQQGGAEVGRAVEAELEHLPRVPVRLDEPWDTLRNSGRLPASRIQALQHEIREAAGHRLARLGLGEALTVG